MKLPSKIKKAVRALGIALALNQVAPALLIPLVQTTYSSRIKPKAESIREYNHLPADLDAFDYLNLANSLVHQYSTRTDNCKDYAFATLETYTQLVEENHREDLEDKVRSVVGIPNNFEDNGHAWLEVEFDGEFTPYESTRSVPITSIEKIKKLSREKYSSIYKDLDKKGWTMARSFNGSRISYPTFQSFFYPGGAVRLYLAGLIAPHN